jgi:hypothetical protein
MGYERACLLKINSQGDSLWSHIYSGFDYGNEVNDIIPTDDSGFLVAGSTWPLNSVGSGIWLFKLDSQGNLIWSRIYSFGKISSAKAIIPSGDGNFIIAGHAGPHIRRNMLIMKVDPEGALIWSHAYGGNGTDGANSIAKTVDNGFLLAGYYTPIYGNQQNLWILKVNAQGDSIWSVIMGGQSSDEATAIIPINNGNFLVTGWYSFFGVPYEQIWLICIEGPNPNTLRNGGPTAWEAENYGEPFPGEEFPPLLRGEISKT